MKRLLSLVGLLALFLAVLLAGGSLLTLYLAQRSLPQLAGTVTVSGLREGVTIVRDASGTPHIYAENVDDLFFAQGFVTAQDRLWQMEFNRRAAWGRLSEVFGPLSLDADRLFRTIGLGRAAAEHEELLDNSSLAALQAYADGVNAYVASREGVLPLEFSLLLTGFEPWRPVDSLAWSKMMAWQLSGNMGSELLRAALVGKVGVERAAVLMPSVPAGVIPQTTPELDYAAIGASVRERLDRVVNLVRPASDELGSNNWVVDGSRSLSGKPLLANDPHLGLQVPSVWYAVHLTGGGLDVVGYSLPGTPGVIIGHNRRIAWGVTNTGADVQDFYVERRNPDNQRQYLFEGQWEEARVVREKIGVRGSTEPIVLEIPYTRHGPILNADAAGEDPIALRWTALLTASMPKSVLSLARAEDWQQFREALRDWDVPSQNFVYADEDGNIGRFTPGAIPIRARGDGLLPVPGWTGEFEWSGYVPYEDLPADFNPERGYIATANDRVVEDDYPYLITHEWAPPFRVERIEQLLSRGGDLDASDMSVIQLDVRSAFAETLSRRLLEAGRREASKGGPNTPNDAVAGSLRLLADWDFRLDPGSPAAAVYNVFYRRLVSNTFADELGTDLFRYYFPASRSHSLAISYLIQEGSSDWFDDTRTDAREDSDAILLRSLDEAARTLARRYGDDPARWRWDALHTVRFVHPLGQLPLLDRLLNRGPYSRGGDATTVSVSGYSFRAPYRESHHASMRMVLDLANWDEAGATITLGQSGQVFSPHYDDQLDDWLDGNLSLLPFSRSAVADRTTAVLEMRPR